MHEGAGKPRGERVDETAPPQRAPGIPCEGTRLKAGTRVEGVVDEIQEQGYGLIRGLYRPLLVPNALPGEAVRVRVTHAGAHQAVGVLEERLGSSPHRREPFCVHADLCGGCDFGFMDYQAQLLWKSGLVARAIEQARVAADPSRMLPTLESPAPLGYRNKLVFNVKFVHPGVIAGLFERHSHRTIDIDACPLQEPAINAAIVPVKRAVADRRWPVYNEKKRTGSLRGFSLRSGTDGRVLLTLVIKQPNLAGVEEQAEAWLREIPGLAGVLLNVHPADTNAVFSDENRLVAGAPTVRTRVGELAFDLGPTTFFQVNTAQAERVIETIAPRVQGCGRLVDAYCGGGLWGLALARHAREVVGLESDPLAVVQAEANAARNGIPHARFLHGDVEELLPAVLDGAEAERAVLLVDPPRKGLPAALLGFLAASALRRIVYVSCNPATLARDLAGLVNGGYGIDGLQPVDMFPHTRHVECVAFLSR